MTLFNESITYAEWVPGYDQKKYQEFSGVTAFVPYPEPCEGTDLSPVGNIEATFSELFPDVQIDRFHPIVFDVTNSDGGLPEVLVSTMNVGTAEQEIAYDGQSFTPRFRGRSYYESIINGLRFHLLSDAGWTSDRIRVRVFLNDPRQEVEIPEGSLEIETLLFVFPFPRTCPLPPDVEFVSPSNEEEIEADQEIIIDVTDASGNLAHVMVVVVDVSTERYELAFDGVAFSMRFSGFSSFSSIANGYRFRLRRTGGWPTEGIEIKVFVTDTLGQTL